jgi:hypothetical protein
MGAINQSISDEELALALDGIGMYATTAPHPVNEAGEPVDWTLGPGRVIEHPPDSVFNRVSGVGSIQPYQDHVGYVEKRIFQATGVSEASMGIVDVSVAQSGISLQLQFQPMVAKTNEKDQDVLAVHEQMFYDLATQWFPTYEAIQFDGMKIMPQIGGKIPIDRVAKFNELNAMMDRKVISTAYYRLEAAKLGYVFPDDIDVQLQSDADREAARDPLGARMAGELNGEPGTTSVDGVLDDSIGG